LNWPARLLPFIEQDALWKQTVAAYQQDHYSLHVPPHVASTVSVSLFVCPADGRRILPSFPAETSPAATSYVGVAGTNEFRRDGLLYLDSGIRFAAIVDGTSQTLMVGERPPHSDPLYGRWYGGWGYWGTADAILGVQESDITNRCPVTSFAFTVGRIQDPCSRFHFWSFHRGGAHFLFADGSVHFLPYTAAPLLPALATRAGGETVTWTD
jgi:prepilin-type processing-associated H-X9-DG protein